MRGATHSGFDCVFFHVFQSTRPMRGATGSAPETAGTSGYFNPRAPYGARRVKGTLVISRMTFQSTRPIRGATATYEIIRETRGISIHAPHTGRDPVTESETVPQETISIHAPHTGRDPFNADDRKQSLKFQSTRPIGGATHDAQHGKDDTGISIHAPHTGRDVYLFSQSFDIDKFQSTRPIRGATKYIRSTLLPTLEFQSTRPIRGATGRICPIPPHKFRISIHAPHTGRDPNARLLLTKADLFQSTRPIRGATAKMHNLCSAFLQ